jgi:hypothetical protein
MQRWYPILGPRPATSAVEGQLAVKAQARKGKPNSGQNGGQNGSQNSG